MKAMVIQFARQQAQPFRKWEEEWDRDGVMYADSSKMMSGKHPVEG
jgi:hypothetical protein